MYFYTIFINSLFLYEMLVGKYILKYGSKLTFSLKFAMS